MRQRILAVPTNSLNWVVAGKVDSQYLVGSIWPLGHSINSHCSSRKARCPSSRCAARTLSAAKRDDNFVLVPSRHFTVHHRRAGKVSANSFYTHWLSIRTASPSCRRASYSLWRLGGQRPRALRPYRGHRLHPHAVFQPHLAQLLAPCRLIAITCIRQHDPKRHPAAFAARICSSAISGLVRNFTSLGTPARLRRRRS